MATDDKGKEKKLRRKAEQQNRAANQAFWNKWGKLIKIMLLLIFVVPVVGFAAFFVYDNYVRGPFLNIDGEVCEQNPFICSNFRNNFRAEVPESLWNVNIRLVVNQDADENHPIATAELLEDGSYEIGFSSQFIFALNEIGIRELAGHEGFHTTATLFMGDTNVMVLNPTVGRLPVVGIRGFTIITTMEGSPDGYWYMNLFEEGAATNITYGPPGNDAYQQMGRLFGLLVQTANWTEEDVWNAHTQADGLIRLCHAAYNALFGENCDAAAFDAMLWRLIAANGIGTTVSLQEWPRLAQETRDSFFGGQRQEILWQMTPQ